MSESALLKAKNSAKPMKLNCQLLRDTSIKNIQRAKNRQHLQAQLQAFPSNWHSTLKRCNKTLKLIQYLKSEGDKDTDYNCKNMQRASVVW